MDSQRLAFLFGKDDVHIWSASLQQDASRVETMLAVLTPDELDRAKRFRFERHRRQYVVGRGLLREILGRYLVKLPAEIRFSYNKYGKPGLADDDNLRFNLAHSHEKVLLGLTLGREIGVDLELRHNDFGSLEIAAQFFSPDEVRILRSLPPEHQHHAFFDCWTRKEAYIKALGEGLSHPLHRFAVSLLPGEPARLLRTDDDLMEASRWSLAELSVFPEYAAALAVKGNRPHVHCRNWPDDL